MESHIFNINSSEEKISRIILSLKSKTAHGCDGISINMPPFVAKPLNLIFTRSLLEGKFPNVWKFANVRPLHKKDNREIKSNYRPISLLPVCGQIIEKIVFDDLYIFIVHNNLITKHQSGFRPGDSTINQLLSITTTIFESFEEYDETRLFSWTYLRLSIMFGMMVSFSNFNVMVYQDFYLTFFNSYLSNRCQRVVLNGIESDWKEIEAGFLKGQFLVHYFS